MIGSGLAKHLKLNEENFESFIKKSNEANKEKGFLTNITSYQKSRVSNKVEYDFKDRDAVHRLIVCLFADYIHDLGDLGILKKKLGTENITNTFSKWCRRITWIDESVLKDIDKSEYLNILVKVMTRIDGRGDKKTIDETQWMNNIKQTFTENVGIQTGSTRDVYKFRGSANPYIAFDQTSKASAPTLIGRLPNVKYDISLPLLADKGSSQVSNPIAGFRSYVRNNDWESIYNTFIINYSDEFFVTFKLNGVEFMNCRYYYTPEGRISVQMRNFPRGILESPILSATDLRYSSFNLGIFKTIGDLNIFSYAIAADSIAATGDRSAGLIYMVLYDSVMRGTLSFGGRRPKFIYEQTATEVVVPIDFFPTKNNKRVPLSNTLEVNKYENKSYPAFIESTLNKMFGANAGGLNRGKVISFKKFINKNSSLKNNFFKYANAPTNKTKLKNAIKSGNENIIKQVLRTPSASQNTKPVSKPANALENIRKLLTNENLRRLCPPCEKRKRNNNNNNKNRKVFRRVARSMTRQGNPQNRNIVVEEVE